MDQSTPRKAPNPRPIHGPRLGHLPGRLRCLGTPHSPPNQHSPSPPPLPPEHPQPSDRPTNMVRQPSRRTTPHVLPHHTTARRRHHELPGPQTPNRWSLPHHAQANMETTTTLPRQAIHHHETHHRMECRWLPILPIYRGPSSQSEKRTLPPLHGNRLRPTLDL